MSLLVVKSGLLSTVQDSGRPGFQRFGVIAGGAMDTFALRAANLLVGNREGAAGLEMTELGPELVLTSPALIALCGGDLSPMLDGQTLPLGRTIFAPQGARLHCGKRRSGCRMYLAVSGGIDVPIVMGSRSTYLRAELGGYSGRALRSGDAVPIGPRSDAASRLMAKLSPGGSAGAPAVSRWYLSPGLMPAYSDDPVLRVVAGAEFADFAEDSRRRFFSESYMILPQSDRMGYRLTGSPLQRLEEKEMLSSAVTFGTVQVPSGGEPIILMADRQTTGGYPKLAQVVAADLPLLAQARPGGRIRFRCIGLREAQALGVERELALHQLRCALR